MGYSGIRFTKSLHEKDEAYQALINIFDNYENNIQYVHTKKPK